MIYDDFQLLKTKEIEQMAREYAKTLKTHQTTKSSQTNLVEIINLLSFQNTLFTKLSKKMFGRNKSVFISNAKKSTSKYINDLYAILNVDQKQQIKKYSFQAGTLEDLFKTIMLKEIEFIEHIEDNNDKTIIEIKKSRYEIIKNLIKML